MSALWGAITASASQSPLAASGRSVMAGASSRESAPPDGTRTTGERRLRRLRAVPATDQARPGRLPDEQRQRRRPLGAGERVLLRRVAGGDEHASAVVDGVGEEVAQPAVLAGRDAGGPVLAY